MLAASSDVLYLLYRSASDLVNRDIYLLTSDNGRAFRGTRIHEWNVAACPMTSMSLSASGAQVWGAWETDGQVFFAPVGRAGLSNGPHAPPGEPSGRKHPRIVANGAGQILLAWTEGAAWARPGTLRWQLFDQAGTALGPSAGVEPVPVWSFAVPVAAPRGGFVIFY